MKRNSLKRTKKNRIIWSLIALAIVVSGAIYYYTKNQTTNQTQTVNTSTIGTGNIILTATGLGTLIPSNEVSFGFKNSGTVSEVLVKLGDRIQVGDVLARLDSKALELKYKQAEANLAALSSLAEIAAAIQAVQDAKESFATARNDLGYAIGPDMLVAEEKVAAAQTELQQAKAAAEKDSSDANQQKVTEAETALTKAQEELNYTFYTYSDTYTLQTFTYPIRNTKGVTTRHELIAPTDADLLAARSAYELAQANLSDAQNYLDILNGTKTVDAVPASSVTSMTDAKLALDSAEAALDATELIAPVSGTVTSLSLNTGDSIGTSAVIAISNLNQPYKIDVSLDETDWDKAKLGFTTSVTFDLLPDETYKGKIVEVYPKLDDSSGVAMVHIVVQLDESTRVDLPVGSTATVDVTGGEALDVLLVPTSALKEVDSGKYIVYLMQNGTPVEQTVEIGLQDILYAEVKSGLQRGDVVLTDASTVGQ